MSRKSSRKRSNSTGNTSVKTRKSVSKRNSKVSTKSTASQTKMRKRASKRKDALTNKRQKSRQQQVSPFHEEQLLKQQDNASSTDNTMEEHIYLIRGRDSDTNLLAWHYILVEDARHEAFLSKVKTARAMDIAQYGKVLYSGWGHDPPVDVIRNVEIMRDLPLFQKDIQNLGFNCTSIKKLDISDE